MTATGPLYAPTPLVTGEESGTCSSLSLALSFLPAQERQDWRAIVLSRGLTDTQTEGNEEHQAIDLAETLIEWEELKVITLPMPRDMNAIGDITDEYDDWQWTLHRILLRAFGRGRFREIRLWHPGLKSDFSTVFLFHNIAEYAEEWVLPVEARCKLKVRRAQYYHSQYAERDDDDEKPRDSASAVNDDCERVWAEKGILIRREVESKGITLVMRWRYEFMREKRQELVKLFAETTKESIDPILWTDRASEPAMFLYPLTHSRVVLCTKHENCFARDGLKHHMIHQHATSEEETLRVLSFFPEAELADTWDDINHPLDGQEQIDTLAVIKGYSCSCGYRTATEQDFVQHGLQTNHIMHPNRAASLFQTLSSIPGQVRFFVVRMRDSVSFPLAGSYGLTV
ncbi:hypothetical protein CNMCM5793_001397 [Aspergillus hiratsukae]|uniref:Uncharacterized protein n=1 Tax=Aspergillus hiratsukae TaxID=1194566 RepID=A0A8H6Q607_9EURO|nr:hypothetical protein CNMCM5793_001397 [Aspergillus hiratsukae]KAF7167126.1 hypothetical protein CNMCM6106_002811 [Aspergillus hiratsukae]